MDAVGRLAISASFEVRPMAVSAAGVLLMPMTGVLLLRAGGMARTQQMTTYKTN